MSGSSLANRANFIEPLEERRLLALNAFGNPTTVNVTGGVPLAYDSAVSSGTGTYIVVQAEAAKSVEKITAVRYSAAGVPIGSPLILIKSNSLGFRTGVAVSMDAAGDAVIAYGVNDGGALAAGLYVSLLSKTGTLGKAVQVTTDAISDPAVSMDSMGRLFVSWLDSSVGLAGDTTVMARSYDATAKARGAAFTVSVSAAGIGDLHIASKPDGSGAIVAFSTIHTIYDLVSPTARADNGDRSLGGAGGSSIAMEADGSFLIGHMKPNSKNFMSAVQRFDSSGNAVGSPIDVSAGLANDSVNEISLAPLSDGGFVAGFDQFQSTDSLMSVYARRFDSSGVSDSSGAVLIASGPFIKSPIIGADADANVVETYQPSTVKNFEDGSTIKYQRLTSDIAAVDQSVLYVFGTDDAAHGDAIAVQTKASSIVVNRGTTIRKFAATEVTGVNIAGLAGNDSIDNATALPSTINGGNGNDTLRGGTGNDLLIGGKGKDKMYGYAGVDTFVAKDNARDTLDGGDGLDILASHDKLDMLRNIP